MSSQESQERSIPATYTLVSFDIESSEGGRASWGKNTHGLLIYTVDGHMSVSINKGVEADPNQRQDLDALFDSILFYAGTYRFDGHIIRHQVTNASDPARIGKELIREFRWEGDLLTLTTPKESFGRAILVWRRLGQ